MSKELDGAKPSILKTQGFEAFRSAYEPRVSRYVRRRVRSDEALGSDLTQDIFVKVLESEGTLRAETRRQELAWLFTVANSVVLGHYRREGLHRKALGRLDCSAGAIDSEFDRVDEREAAERLCPMEVLKNMKWPLRRAIELRVLEGRDYETIGEMFDETPDAMRMRVERGLQQLRDLLGGKDDGMHELG